MLSFNAERTLCFCDFANDLKTALLGLLLIFRKEIFRLKRPIKCLQNDAIKICMTCSVFRKNDKFYCMRFWSGVLDALSQLPKRWQKC